MRTAHEAIPTVRRLVRERGSSIAPSDLETLIAQHASVSRRRGLLALPLILALLATIVLANVAGPGDLWHLVSVVVCVGAVIGLFLLLLLEVLASHEYREAERVLRHLNEERTQTGWALDMAASGQPFALFLRSFQAEDRGSSSSEVDAHNRALFEQSNVYSHMAGWHVGVPPDHLEDPHNSWSMQRQVLNALSGTMPTVMLGNMYLTPEKRSDLAGLDVRDVTVVAGDWWSVFLALSGAAREIVIYADEPTGMLRREIEQLDGTERRYTLVLNRAIEPGLGPVAAEGERSGRISIIRYDDYGDSIDDALKQRWPS